MLVMLCSAVYTLADQSYTIVDTGQIRCYNNSTEIQYPKNDDAFFGQDAQYNGNQPAYKDNGDGTVTDLNTALMWTQNPGSKRKYAQAVADAFKCKVGSYNDWRLPTIKELYSLILFSGIDPDPRSTNLSILSPFIDTKYFKFQYGQAQNGDRIIDSQYATSTVYRSTTMRGNKTMFGVNFADGRIKGYPIGISPRGEKKYYVMYVRSNPDYGKNDFKDNSGRTVTDNATGLMWMKLDSGHLKAGLNKDGKLNWQQALEWAENLEFAGYNDWRLPNAKELQGIVDYRRCPDVTKSAAIDPIFEVTSIINEGGKIDYPCYWTGTNHYRVVGAQAAVYVAFGRSLGWMQDHRTSQRQLLDVHGAGAQRSDPKTGDPSQFPFGRGPQGDVIRIYNYVRCVRGGKAEPCTTGPKIEINQISHASQPKLVQTPQTAKRRRQGPSGADFIRRLDSNDDGKISRQEFDGPYEHFQRLDKNKDGYLSSEEAPLGPPPNRTHRPPDRNRRNSQRK